MSDARPVDRSPEASPPDEAAVPPAPLPLAGAGGPVGGPVAGEVLDALNQPLLPSEPPAEE